MKAICASFVIQISGTMKPSICFKITGLTSKFQIFKGMLKSNKNHFFYMEIYLLLSNKKLHS